MFGSGSNKSVPRRMTLLRWGFWRKKLRLCRCRYSVECPNMYFSVLLLCSSEIENHLSEPFMRHQDLYNRECSHGMPNVNCRCEEHAR